MVPKDYYHGLLHYIVASNIPSHCTYQCRLLRHVFSVFMLNLPIKEDFMTSKFWQILTSILLKCGDLCLYVVYHIANLDTSTLKSSKIWHRSFISGSTTSQVRTPEGGSSSNRDVSNLHMHDKNALTL